MPDPADKAALSHVVAREISRILPHTMPGVFRELAVLGHLCGCGYQPAYQSEQGVILVHLEKMHPLLELRLLDLSQEC